MGFDLSIVTNDEILDAQGKRAKYHYPVDRGFCTFIENAINSSTDLIEEVERALQLDLRFLLIPQYYDPKSFSEEEFREMGLTEDQIKEAYSQPVEGFVEIDLFLNKLKLLQERFTEIPDYELKMNYDRKWWLSYFGVEFRTDIQSLVNFLENARKQGQIEFAFRVA